MYEKASTAKGDLRSLHIRKCRGQIRSIVMEGSGVKSRHATLHIYIYIYGYETKEDVV